MRARMLAAVVVPLAVLSVIAVVVPVGAGAEPTAPAPKCLSLGDPVPADRTLQVTTVDNGASVCLLPGQRLSVALWVDPDLSPDPGTWWGTVTATGKALAQVPDTALPVRGATLATFQAVEPGQATVGATRHVCGQTSDPRPCLVMSAWKVTVEVFG